MKNGIVGVIFSLLTVSLSFLLFSVIVNGKTMDTGILVGMVAVSFYAAPFVIIGAIISNYSLIRLAISPWLIYVLHAILGGLLAVLAVYLYNFDAELRMTVFIISTGVVGSILFVVGLKFSEKFL